MAGTRDSGTKGLGLHATNEVPGRLRGMLGKKADKMVEGRVVRYRVGLVSWIVMHLQARFSFIFAVVLAVGVCAGVRMQAQDAGSQNPPVQNPPAQNQPAQQPSSSSQSQPTQTPAEGPDAQNANYGVYISDASVWLTQHWGFEGSGRAYVGTSGTAPNAPNNIHGPMVKQYFFVGGAEWLGPHNKHGSMEAHAMAGGVYGNFQKDLLGQPPAKFDFYSNQMAPAAIVGGSIDLNRSEHWVFRINPDAIMTHYTFYNTLVTPNTSYAQYDVNFAISVGLEYKFTKAKRSTKKANWVSGW